MSTRMYYRTIALLAALTAALSVSNAQHRLILNGGTVNITQGAYLVIENPAADAITRTSGYIISEGQDNVIKWNIGTATGAREIPWGYNGDYLPLLFTPSGAAGATGYFLFSTYHTGWQNSAELPTGVSNFNRASGGDNSAYAIDRFWRMEAINYTTRPTLSNVTFTYPDIEHTAPNNTIIESGLRAQRWNSSFNTWTDYDPLSSINTTTNQLTIQTITPGNLFAWWTLTYLADRHWIANVNSNWNSSANWSTVAGGTGGATVPAAVDDVFFDAVLDGNATIDVPVNIASLTVAPGYSGTITQGAQSINVSGTATFGGGIFSGGSSRISVGNTFTLSGATFTATSDTLDLQANFGQTAGSFLHNSGTVKFSGSGQTQSVTSSALMDFNNIRVSNTSATGLSFETDENIRGVLSLATNVKVDADGTGNTSVLTLISTADNPVQDAAVGILPAGADITGNVTVQRFMSREGSNNRRIYRYISSPLQNATVADIQQEILITGSFTGYSVCPTCLTNQSMFLYDEQITTDVNGDNLTDREDGYVDFPDLSNTETLQPGRGYALFVRANIIPSVRWDVRGVLTKGNVTPISFPVSYTPSGNITDDGWNLVGNPFASAIDWNAATGWTKSNLDATIYIQDNGAMPRKVAAWNGVVGVNGGSRYLALGQGFWVKANGSGPPVLTANENIKAPGQSAEFMREVPLREMLRISLTHLATTDEAVIHFREDASDGYDPHADAHKLKNESLNLATLAGDGSLLAINSRSSSICQDSVQLSIDDVAPGTYALDLSNISSFTDEDIVLHDYLLNKHILFKNDSSYTFPVSIDPTTFGSRRFSITFANNVSLSIAEDNGKLTVPYEKNVQWYFNDKLLEGANGSSIHPAASGVYRAVVQHNGCALSATREYTVTALHETLHQAIRVYPNPTAGEFFVTMQTLPESMVIVDPLGKRVGTISLRKDNDHYSGSFNLKDQPSGIYMLIVRSKKLNGQIKIIRR